MLKSQRVVLGRTTIFRKSYILPLCFLDIKHLISISKFSEVFSELRRTIYLRAWVKNR